EITLENYCKTVIIEANTMVTMARGEIAPAVEAYAKEIAKTASLKKAVSDEIPCAYETNLLKKLSALTERISYAADELDSAICTVGQCSDIVSESESVRDELIGKMGELRVACDEAEVITSRKFWPFPTYGELLFGVR
ncbi:MAG: glutamine synthetase type III, partial [Oscillospiraceae bacterium]|nr:glutamine synthetase type III [Oscillospiraceae bacterium]